VHVTIMLRHIPTNFFRLTMSMSFIFLNFQALKKPKERSPRPSCSRIINNHPVPQHKYTMECSNNQYCNPENAFEILFAKRRHLVLYESLRTEKTKITTQFQAGCKRSTHQRQGYNQCTGCSTLHSTEHSLCNNLQSLSNQYRKSRCP